MPFVKKSLTLMMLSTGGLFVSSLTFANTDSSEEQKKSTATLPTIVIEAMADGDPIKTYVDYKQANVTRNGLDKKDIPQTVDTIDVSKYKLYGANDLSIMLQGTPGVSTSYDTEMMESLFVDLMLMRMISIVMVCVKAGNTDAVLPMLNELKF